MTTMLSTAGRGDDTRALNICDLMAPRLVTAIGPSSAKAHCLVLHGGKTNHSGRPEIMASIRHTDPGMCAIHARARLFFQRYTINHEQFPLPTDEEAW